MVLLITTTIFQFIQTMKFLIDSIEKISTDLSEQKNTVTLKELNKLGKGDYVHTDQE